MAYSAYAPNLALQRPNQSIKAAQPTKTPQGISFVGNARMKLQRFEGKQASFSADVAAISFSSINKTPLILLTNVRCRQTQELLTDHMWLHQSKFGKVRYDKGDSLFFQAEAECYTKSSGKDYHFVNIRNCRRLSTMI